MATRTRTPATKPAARPRYRDILFEVKDQVAWVTINRPRVQNAFREQPLDEMTEALRSTREDPSIACAVVTGAGTKAFSAGGVCPHGRRHAVPAAPHRRAPGARVDLPCRTFPAREAVAVTEESLEGMRAFLEGRAADFDKFRRRSKKALDAYLEGLARGENQPPALR